MAKTNTAYGTLSKKKISSQEMQELKKHITSNSFDMVADYYGAMIDQLEQKEKKKMKMDIQKIIERKICQYFKIPHIKNLKWIDLIEAKMFVDDLSINDIKNDLQTKKNPIV